MQPTSDLTATSATSALSGTTTVTVVVNPQTDTVLITVADYRPKQSRLDINATDFRSDGNERHQRPRRYDHGDGCCEPADGHCSDHRRGLPDQEIASGH